MKNYRSLDQLQKDLPSLKVEEYVNKLTNRQRRKRAGACKLMKTFMEKHPDLCSFNFNTSAWKISWNGNKLPKNCVEEEDQNLLEECGTLCISIGDFASEAGATLNSGGYYYPKKK